MNILIVTTSYVVEELLRLILKDKNHTIESQDDVENAKLDRYDIIFIDDSVQDISSQIEYAQNGLKSQVVLMTNLNNKIEADFIVIKPFLPQDIEKIIDNIENNTIEATATNILDPEEIAKIKELMEINEFANQNEPKNIELLKDKKSLKVKKKEAKELLLELSKLNKKELKKLLKGAKVSIKIAYKKGKDE